MPARRCPPMDNIVELDPMGYVIFYEVQNTISREKH